MTTDDISGAKKESKNKKDDDWRINIKTQKFSWSERFKDAINSSETSALPKQNNN